MFEDLEEVRMKTLDAIRLTELARLSALTQIEFNGFVYGLKKDKKFQLKGIVPVYEKSSDGEVRDDRTIMYIEMLEKANPDYLFLNYHSHPNGPLELSGDDIKAGDDLEIVLWAEALYSGYFFWKKVVRVGHGVIKAYKIIENGGEREAVEIPVRIEHSHNL